MSYLWLLNLKETLECRGCHCLFTVRLPGQSTDRNQPKPAKKSIVAVFLGEIDGNWTLVNRERKSIPKIAKLSSERHSNTAGSWSFNTGICQKLLNWLFVKKDISGCVDTVDGRNPAPVDM